jgi:predicted MFS family arabinose efflux permease
LPVVLREQGVDLATIGFASLLSLPWIAKVVWAPLADRWYWARLGRRRSWLLPAQAGMLAVCLVFVHVRPEDGLMPVLVLFFVLNVLAATQDVAVDGLAVDLLDDDELGPGNAAQVAGFKLGNLLGGGVLLALSAWLGWAGDFWLMSAVLAVAMLMVLRTSEPPPASSVDEDAGVGEVLRRLARALRGQGLRFWALLFYAKFGESVGGAMTKPMLVDAGWTRSQIGLVDGTFGALATIVGAALGGLALRRWGWRDVLAHAAVGQGLALTALAAYVTGPITLLGYGTLAAAEAAFGGAVGVGVFALAMSHRDRAVGASQFTVAQVVYMSGAAVAAPIAGAAADAVGYAPVIAAGGAMAVSLVLLLWRGRD